MERCSATTLTGEQCKLISKEGCDGKCSRHSGEPCPVCFLPMNSKNSKKLENCTHIFHMKCIDKWKKKHNTCPTCRAKIENTMYNVSIHIEPVGIRAEMVSNNVTNINTLFGIETEINLDNFVTDIQFSTQIEEDIRHILQEIGFPVTTFPARTQ